MKSTEQQIRFAEGVANHIKFMTSGNDIDSPSHYYLNETESEQIAERFVIDENQRLLFAAELNEIFDKILNLIRTI